LKILIVSQYFWPENFRVNDLAAGLRDKKHQVTILTGQPNYPEGLFYPGYGFFQRSREDYGGIDVIRVPLVPRGSGGGLRLALNYISFAFFASLLAPFRCRDKYDVIFVYEPSPITVGLPAVLLKRLKRVPIMFWVQDLWPESLTATGAVHSGWILRLVERLVRFIYQRCDLLLVQSRAFFLSVEKLGADRGRILYFPNTSEEFYQPLQLPDDAPERREIPGGFCVMFAGNIGAAQDFGTILGAAGMLKCYPDIHWVVLGEGRMSSWVKGEVTQRGLAANVHLLGSRPAESMPRYFSLADVMLATLKREPIFALTIPSKIQSYLACGRPIVAALDGEGARIVEEAGAGLTAPAEDPEALAAAVLAMYKMTAAERGDMGLLGRVYFEKNFERNLLLARLDAWMEKLAGGGQCAS
jgi:colanic acid biosynthesis glycosyl transferase WcaI